MQQNRKKRSTDVWCACAYKTNRHAFYEKLLKEDSNGDDIVDGRKKSKSNKNENLCARLMDGVYTDLMESKRLDIDSLTIVQ